MENYEIVKEDIGTGKEIKMTNLFYRQLWEGMSCETEADWQINGLEKNQLRTNEGERKIIIDQ